MGRVSIVLEENQYFGANAEEGVGEVTGDVEEDDWA